ncbi:MAG TPA: ferritin-like domain-containing protein [Methylocella sp.]|nr:ferritin-like domain-containing protein [Methylocella sp.]
MAKQPRTLEELFLATLKDMYFAEKRILAALPKMAKAAQSEGLKAALEKHRGETEAQVGRLEDVFEAMDKKPTGKTCPAMIGILDEGSEVMTDFRGSPALDAGLIGAARSVEHYEISRYETLCILAQELELKDAVSLLEENLGEEKATDATLCELAKSVLSAEAKAA